MLRELLAMTTVSVTTDAKRRMQAVETCWEHERFAELIRVHPMQYRAEWRMQAAARLLLEIRGTVASIALEVGYDSEAAFARAFERAVGKPPAVWRRELDTASGQAIPPR